MCVRGVGVGVGVGLGVLMWGVGWHAIESRKQREAEEGFDAMLKDLITDVRQEWKVGLPCCFLRVRVHVSRQAIPYNNALCASTSGE